MKSRVHETAFIGIGVTLGENVTIGPFVTILGPCRIHDSVWIGANAIIGAPPESTSATQNVAWDGEIEHAGVEIKSDVVIREGAIVHQGTHRPTLIGAGTWILNRAYLAHDVQVGQKCIISAGVSIGGHCTIGDQVNIGMNASIHQRVVIGSGTMVGMATPVTKDVPPFAKVFGNPISLRGANTLVLQQKHLTGTEIAAIEFEYLYARECDSNFFSSRNFAPIKNELNDWLGWGPRKVVSVSTSSTRTPDFGD